MLTLTSNYHLVDLDNCLSIGGMSVDNDFMAMKGDDDDSASASVFEDIMIQLAQEHIPAKDRREEIFRSDSIRSLDAGCWIDDELFVDAVVDVFEHEEPAQAQMHTYQDFGMQQQMMNAQRQPMQQQQSIESIMNNNAQFEEVWNAKMAQLARSMKRSEGTRHQVIRQREILLAEQNQAFCWCDSS
jgi:long-subunit acyl-CoA synthetase (AMP-forming)